MFRCWTGGGGGGGEEVRGGIAGGGVRLNRAMDCSLVIPLQC